MKTLSVVMLNYNDAEYLSEALEAVLAQSYSPSEVIVVDDGSTDHSLDVLEKFMRKSPVLRVLRNERNLGVIPALKRGIEAACGDYVYCAASNDRILPELFEKCMSVLHRNPALEVCSTDYALMSSEGKMLGEVRQRLRESASSLSPKELAETIRRKPGEGIVMSQAVSVTKREALLENFFPELNWHVDGFGFLMISLRNGLGYVPEPLVAIRLHPQSYASNRGDWREERRVLVHMIEILKSRRCRDILPLVKRSGVLSFYGASFLRVAVSSPRYWNLLSPLVVRKIFSPHLARVRNAVPAPIRKAFRIFRNKKNAGPNMLGERSN